MKTRKTAKKAKKEPRKPDFAMNWALLLIEAVTKPGLISKAYSQFHRYSLGNQMLVAWQCIQLGMEIGPFCGFKHWREEFDRSVIKGSKALFIYIPISRQYEKENEQGEKEKKGYTGFMLRPTVFVYSQTQGKEIQRKKATDRFSQARALKALGITKEAFTDTNGNCMGYARSGNRIAINPLNPHKEKTFFHETAHCLLGHFETGVTASLNSELDTPKSLQEIEAESVALLCTESLGLKGAEYSRGYIQTWKYGLESIPERSAQRIFSVANKILEAGLNPCAV